MSSAEERISQLEHRVFELREENANVLKELKKHKGYYDLTHENIDNFDKRLHEKESYKGFAWFWGVVSLLLLVALLVVTGFAS